jgi:enoyl-CoA hydratase/carnithine racemase
MPRLRLDSIEPSIVALPLARAAGPNVMDEDFCAQLQTACEALAQDQTLYALLLRAEGSTFCVGEDVSALHAHRDTSERYVGDLIDLAMPRPWRCGVFRFPSLPACTRSRPGAASRWP